MAIKILPAQLANQIAAGEVVERPASVVKELVENSLDAGASRIEIDIEKGGARLIRIRDNGCGIGKDDLALSLARHATSKIASLEDLEAIISMGFRGEALASISSVSRLTITSRTDTQSEAWQAYAEGRDMAVTVKPAAHPVGCTVEVMDLFYNTPARRKFMRTDKTEFAHIDEIVKRIALARFDVTFTLQHNGKTVRQYRAANAGSQHMRRLGNLCGAAFVQRALEVSWNHGDLNIRGWVADPRGEGDLPEMQYCYVNNRMMRDKLINHAIRQAYQEQLSDGQQPAFVLYLDVSPHQVDVNVHPAKHEVRFHQARLVHDFIYQAVIAVLAQHQADPLTLGDTDAETVPATWSPENRAASGTNHFSTPAVDSRELPVGQRDIFKRGGDASAEGRAYTAVGSTGGGSAYTDVARDPSQHQTDPVGAAQKMRDRPGSLPREYQRREGEIYRRLLDTAAADDKRLNSAEVLADKTPPVADDVQSFGKVLTIYPPCYALVEFRHRLALISLPFAERGLRQKQLTPGGEILKAQPLLIPLRLTLKDNEARAFGQYQAMLAEMAIAIQVNHRQAILNAVPLPLRQQNLQNLIPELLGYLSHHDSLSHDDIAAWIARQLNGEQHAWSHSQAIQLLCEVERLCPHWVKAPPDELLVLLELEAAVKALKND